MGGGGGGRDTTSYMFLDIASDLLAEGEVLSQGAAGDPIKSLHNFSKIMALDHVPPPAEAPPLPPGPDMDSSRPPPPPAAAPDLPTQPFLRGK
ncbi:hypothetical protein F7725_025338, partial [Dissostichus mawsoni]